MQKVVIAPDKFKGSLTGLEFCNIVEQCVLKYHPAAKVVKLPLADGGDGTVEALSYYMGGEFVELEVHDPLMRKVKATYLFSVEKKMAFIEMAEASGIRLLTSKEANPMQASTYGTGELIADAIKKGAKQIILGIGGSATNDAGMGMARALGFQFFDKDNNPLDGKGEDLAKLHHIMETYVLPELKDVAFEIACDVDNPLFGKNGAAHIYAPQKGASPRMVEQLDRGLQNVSQVVQKQYRTVLGNMPGAGAAGGMGFGAMLFLGATLKPGIDLIKGVANFDHEIQDAEWIITGEGKLDSQTFSGKVIKGVLDSRTNQRLAIFCGANELTKEEIHLHNIDHVAEIKPLAKNHEDSMNNSAEYLRRVTDYFMRKIEN